MRKYMLNITLYILILLSGTFTVWSIFCPAPMRTSTTEIKSYATDFWWDINLKETPLNIVIKSNLTTYYEKIELWQVEMYYTSEIYGGQEIRIYSILLYPKGKEGLPGIILLHGYGEEIEQMFSYARFLAAHDYAVLLIDAPGHGRSSSFPQPTPDNIVNVTHGPFGSYLAHLSIATLRGLEVIKKQEFIDKFKLGICGFDIGGVIAFIVGRVDWNVKAIASISASGNYLLAIASGGLANIMIPAESRLSSEEILSLCRYFDALAYLRDINKNVLLIVSTNDEYIPLEAINETFSIIPSENKFISIAPNWGHYLEYDEREKLILKFFNAYLKGLERLNQPEVYIEEVDFQLAKAYYIGLTRRREGKIFFRPALLGFPWIEAYMDTIAFSVIPSGVEYYAANISNKAFEVTTPIRIIGRNSYLLPVILIISIVLLISRTKDWKHMTVRIAYWLPLLISMFLPIVTVWDRFTITLPHVIERFGVLLGIINFAWILILIGVASTLVLTLKDKFLMASIVQLIISILIFIMAISIVRLKEIPIPNIGFILPILMTVFVLIQMRRKRPEIETKIIKVLPPVKKEENKL